MQMGQINTEAEKPRWRADLSNLKMYYKDPVIETM
jgi:hypothetical protein